jgi:Dolichyl-phosphate-mannose-protein mannosyltransferase
VLTLTRPPTWLLLGGLVAVSTLVRFWAGTAIESPWIMPDEVIYAELAESLYREGRFEVLGQPADFLSLVYPALFGPLLALDDLEAGYLWTKLAQALVMSLAAVPAYLWARRLASRRWALVAAGLTLAVPGLAYSGLLMTEVVFYPVTVLAAFAMARALERPTLGAQLLVVATVALAAFTRLQLFVLVPVFATALAALLLLERRPRDVLRFTPSLAGLGMLCLGWAGWRLRDGGPLSRLFGGYEPAGAVDYGVRDAARFALYHAADVVVLTGIFPVCALVLLWASRGKSPALRAYLAVASALSVWLVVEVGVFASGLVGYLAERNQLPLAPVLFVGFAAWLSRGGPRPRLATAATCVGVLALVVVLPVRELVSPSAFPNSFSLLPLIELEASAPDLNLDGVAVAVAAAALLAFALVSRRRLWVLPLVLAVALLEVSAWTSSEIADRAAFAQRQSVGSDRRWVDRSADGPAALLYLGELNWPLVWQNAFWNRRIERVYGLLTARVVGGLPHVSVGPLEDGRLVQTNGRPIAAGYAVASYPVTFRGKTVTSAGEGLVLWRLKPPVRLSVWTQRVAGHVRVLVYACGPGELRLELEGPPRAAVELRRNEAPQGTVRLDDLGTWAGVMPAAPPKPTGTRVCTFDVVSPPEVVAPVVRFVRKGSAREA